MNLVKISHTCNQAHYQLQIINTEKQLLKSLFTQRLDLKKAQNANNG